MTHYLHHARVLSALAVAVTLLITLTGCSEPSFPIKDTSAEFTPSMGLPDLDIRGTNTSDRQVTVFFKGTAYDGDTFVEDVTCMARNIPAGAKFRCNSGVDIEASRVEVNRVEWNFSDERGLIDEPLSPVVSASLQ